MVENIKTYDVLISGRVQGVGFRYFTVSIAGKYDVRGYVANKPDGKVEIICQGEQEELESFLDEVKKGPAFSVVTDISIDPIENPRNYNTFEIKF